MQEQILADLVAAFNRRDFTQAGRLAAEGLVEAEGRDEIFWMGLADASEGFRCLLAGQPQVAERHLVTAMHNLRTFGFSHRDCSITVLLAGLRRCAEEIRLVRARQKRIFDITLLPQLRLAVKEQQSA